MLYKFRIDFLKFLLFNVYHINAPNNKKARLYDLFDPIYDARVFGDKIRLYCQNYRVYKRSESILRKEPDTIEWIESFSSGETLFDVGANIGLYSLLAAKRGAKVIAFEPESQNYSILNKNIYINSLDENITALNIALSDQNGLDYLYVPIFSSGTAFNQLEHSPRQKNGQTRKGFKQGIFSYTLDSFTEAFSEYFPNHIKIDVDGIQAKIIAGASRTLENPKVQSILIELDQNLTADQEAIDLFLSKGFDITSRTAKLERGVFNYIFRR